MHHVFVSYSRQDSAWAVSLMRALEAKGIATWLDQRDIPVTLPWLIEVRDAIEESDLFLICDSAAWRASAQCALERTKAENLGKRQFKVVVGADLAAAVMAIALAYERIPSAVSMRTELSVAARSWDRTGRSRAGLVSLRRRRQLGVADSLPPPITEPESAFLNASRARGLRRSAVSAAAVVIVAAAVVSSATIGAVRSRIEAADATQAFVYSEGLRAQNTVNDDPYAGLSLATQQGSNESASHAEVLMAALQDPTPTDAFDVPAQATHFSEDAFGSTVGTTDGRGHHWSHPNGRVAHTPVISSAASTMSAAAVPHTNQVRVFQRGQLLRTVQLPRVPSLVSVSPDGRFLAGAFGLQVEIMDLATGKERQRLRGGPGTVLDVAWSLDGQLLWTLTHAKVEVYRISASTTLVNDTAISFNSVLASATKGAVWAASDSGTFTEFEVTTGKILERRSVPTGTSSAGVSPDGALAAAPAQDKLWLIPLMGSAVPRQVPIPRCAAGRPVFLDVDTVLLPCFGGDLLTIDVGAATVKGRVGISTGGRGAYGTGVLTPHQSAVVGDGMGALYTVSGTDVHKIWQSQCGGSIIRVAVSRDGNNLAPVGAGTGDTGCMQIGTRSSGPTSPGSWTWNSVLGVAGISTFATSVVFSNTGKTTVIGFSDGTVALLPTANVLPVRRVFGANGRVRDMVVVGSDTLVLVTSTGLLQTLNLCDTCLSNRSMAQEAKLRLEIADRLGFAVHVPPQGSSPTTPHKS